VVEMEREYRYIGINSIRKNKKSKINQSLYEQVGSESERVYWREGGRGPVERVSPDGGRGGGRENVRGE